MKRNDLAFGVAQKLGEIPGYLLSLASLTVIEGALAAQVAIKFACLRSIDFRFGQDGELDIISKDKLSNLCRGSRLLASKLIARYGNYFQTLLIILPMQLNHLFVVQIG